MNQTTERELTDRPQSFSLYARHKAALRECSDRTGRSMSELVRQAIDELLEREAAERRAGQR